MNNFWIDLAEKEKGFEMTQDQVLKDIEDMMSIVKKEKETLEKILANLEADNEGKPDTGDGDRTGLSKTQS